MAKFTDYTEKTEPVDTDLALIYDTQAKVNKKFTFGNLWKWIAKKIVSEGISQLDTTNKTIPGAINELNSKSFYMVNSGVTDWDDVNCKGIYSGRNAKNSPDYSNDLWINSIVLASNNNNLFLYIIAFYSSHIAIRTMESGKYGSWVVIK